MKLDPKCTIAVLTAIEEAVSCRGSFVYTTGEPKPKGLEPYSDDQITYHIHQCDLSGYLIGCAITGNGAMVFVEDLDPKGHEKLAESRESKLLNIGKQAFEDSAKDKLEDAINYLPGWIYKAVILFRSICAK